MTDDQDLHLDSMSVMPQVKNLIGKEGVTYNKHYCTVAICCPSRVNFLTGKAAHNTNVTSLKPPYGGWPKFTEQNLNDNYLPVWIQDAGIRTSVDITRSISGLMTDLLLATLDTTSESS
jgi:arylsulfatase A-like enzyme